METLDVLHETEEAVIPTWVEKENKNERIDLALLLAPDVSTAEVLASPEYQAANG